MKKKAQKTVSIDDDDEKRWQTQSDFDALSRFAEIKKDPERKKRLIAHIKEQQNEVNAYDDAYLKSIGL